MPTVMILFSLQSLLLKAAEAVALTLREAEALVAVVVMLIKPQDLETHQAHLLRREIMEGQAQGVILVQEAVAVLVKLAQLQDQAHRILVLVEMELHQA